MAIHEHTRPRPLAEIDAPSLDENSTDRQRAHAYATIAAQAVHNTHICNEWLDRLWNEIKHIRDRLDVLEMSDGNGGRRLASKVDRLVDEITASHHVPPPSLTSERVREVIKTEKYGELSSDQRERRAFRNAVIIAVIAAAVGVFGGRVSACGTAQVPTVGAH